MWKRFRAVSVLGHRTLQPGIDARERAVELRYAEYAEIEHLVRVGVRLGSMHTRKMGKADFDEIVRVIDEWWGGPTAALAHPLYFYELGQHARVMEHEGKLIGFLFGFVTSNDPPLGYVHLIGIHPQFRRRHVGQRLYESFEQSCAQAGCRMMKAITPVGNARSRAFHRALGWREQVIEDYAGPGRDRVVFYKEIASVG